MGLKFCPKCEETKPEEDFKWNQNRRYSYCYPCDRKRQNERNRMCAEEWAKIVGRECIKCGYDTCLAALEFHHRDPADKLFPVSSKLYTTNPHTCKPDTKQQILLEVNKCDLLCANCHREVHYKEKADGS